MDATPAGAVATAWSALHALCTGVVTAVGLPAPSHPSEVGARLTSLGASPYMVMVIERLHRLSADALREPATVTGTRHGTMSTPVLPLPGMPNG
ncbi:hypothetical protein [Streptomyces chromofuscus]|uniref:Uncharacterized protein n=1 Tax=Streptomyces chromofuscus TaxID=42881 RepID=A0A7M2TC96_STRCW|nr:hypothetical protein [Streptomyces chromofuscus]QOV45769.1 hypothetical protein IPT68_07545 [Streptomyces chromofuscus]GGT17738.1 hypothetical protein GCM10010254_42860 [Streptomyces chromofuscus]